jgi:hypothetical protein
MNETRTATRDPARFVRSATLPQEGRLLHIHLHLADRALVVPGQRVELGQPLVERFRDQEAVEIPTTAALIAMRPGDILDGLPEQSRGRLGRRSATTRTSRARLIEHGRDGISRFATGSGDITVHAPAAGIIESALPGRLDLRAEGLALEGRIGWGRPSAGRLLIAAKAPDAEIRASSIDVGASGAILVAGPRIDVEAISRARAIGAAAVITGGVSGRDMRQMTESEQRQQAALHAAAPFGLLALGGHARLPIPRHLWDLLTAAEGRPAGIHPDARLLIIGGDPRPLLEAMRRPPGTVRIRCGECRDAEGTLVGLSGPRRWPGGTYAPGGFVERVSEGGATERICVPVADLERLA